MPRFRISFDSNFGLFHGTTTQLPPATAPPARYLPGNTGATPEDATADVSRSVLAPLDGGHTVERFGQSFEIEDSKHVVQPFFQYSRCVGRRKALLVGINYTGTNHTLKGCINDVKNMHKFIYDRFGYAKENIVVLTDDTNDAALFPTKANIVKYMQWLVEDAGYDDALYFHYSGHGTQVQDRALDESDDADEAICPFDFETAGMLRDDESECRVLSKTSGLTHPVHELLVKPLPAGARLTAIFDSCHSGSIMDIPYVYNPEKPPKEPVMSPVGDKSWLSQGIKHNRKLIQQIAELLAAATKPAPPGPALLRAANVPEGAELDWDKMPLKHKLFLVEALKEHAVASVETAQAGTGARDQASGAADDTSRSALSQFIKHNPKLVKAARAAATQAVLQVLGARGVEGDVAEDPVQNDKTDTDRKLHWGRFRPPPIPTPVAVLGDTIASSFGVPPGTVIAGAAAVNAIRGVDGAGAIDASQLPKDDGANGAGTNDDNDRSWLSQAVRHNRKTLNRIAQVIADALVNYVAGEVSKDRSIELMAATGSSPADVICWSGCLDDQKATDTFLNGQAVGAMSYAFITAMNQNPTQSYMELLKAIRAFLKDKYTQTVQLSSSHPINTDLEFIA